ncbi:MAG: TonB-dependent receptor plug domain-containing protein [Pseudomonadota bacterium]
MKITYLSQVSVLALAVGAWGFLGLATVEIAHAQDGAPPVTGEETTVGEDQTISLEETSAPVGGETELEAVTIEVTARREAEDLLNVPASVAVDQNPSESIQNPSEGAAEVGRRVPNYSVNDVGTPTQTFGAVRGVGTLGFPLNAFDTTITYAVNGLPISLLAGSHQLLDLERVEVLRGPQNVLFGRSSQGGTINYVTRKPDGERDIRVRGEIGTDGEFLTDVILGGTIIEDRLNGRGSFRFTGGDGFVQNIPTGETLPDRQILGGRGALRAFLTNRTTLDVSGYFEQDERETFSSFILPDGPDFPASSVVPPQTSDRDLFIGDAVLRHEFNKFDLTTSFGYQRINFESVSDSTDGLIFSELTGAPSFFFDTPGTDEGILAQEERTFFGEIRATSSPDADTRWIMGVGVYRSNFDSMVTGVNSFGAPIPNGVNDTDLTLTDVSGFGEVSLNVTDRLTFTPAYPVFADV